MGFATKIDENTVVVHIYRPDKEKYHFHAHDEGKCPPMAQGRGCYGDCYDCYGLDLDRFEQYKKAAEDGL